MSTSHIQTLRAMLREEKGVILPGAPNALAARIIADLGFKAVYLTGAGLTNMHLGWPDLGFMDLSQVADHGFARQRTARVFRTYSSSFFPGAIVSMFAPCRCAAASRGPQRRR